MTFFQVLPHNSQSKHRIQEFDFFISNKGDKLKKWSRSSEKNATKVNAEINKGEKQNQYMMKYFRAVYSSCPCAY